LEGLRNKVTNLRTSVDTDTQDATYVGLFGAIDVGGTVRNLGIETAAGGIKGAELVGVLAGKNAGTISASYSKGLVTGSTNAVTVRAIGGLVGLNEGSISESFSTANVDAATGNQAGGMGVDGGIGGLVGVSNSNVANSIYASYATGQVKGGIDVGGLIGFHQLGAVQAVHSRGEVMGPLATTGGLVGTSMVPFLVTDGYWDTTTSTQAAGFGASTAPGGGATGYDTANMKLAANFTGGGTFNFNAPSLVAPPGNWVIYDTFSYPVLRTFLTPLFVYADNKTKAYDGSALGGFTSTLSFTADNAKLSGVPAATIAYSGTGTTSINAGTGLVITPGTLDLADKTDQHGYLLNFINGTASITPKAVNLTPQAATKVFDGTTNYTAAPADLAVLSALLGVGGETVTGVTLTYDTAAVGVGKMLTPSAATVSSAAGNYNISYTANATSVITAVPAPPAPVVVVPPTVPAPLIPATNPADTVVRLVDGGHSSRPLIPPTPWCDLLTVGEAPPRRRWRDMDPGSIRRLSLRRATSFRRTATLARAIPSSRRCHAL
jgi:hypothetical protein